jgi:hypothetical protein
MRRGNRIAVADESGCAGFEVKCVVSSSFSPKRQHTTHTVIYRLSEQVENDKKKNKKKLRNTLRMSK